MTCDVWKKIIFVTETTDVIVVENVPRYIVLLGGSPFIFILK